MRRLSAFLATLALIAAPMCAAHADTYTFGISTGTSSLNSAPFSFTAAGTLTGDPYMGDSNVLSLTGVSGTAPDYTFVAVVPLGAYPGISYDNLLFVQNNAPHVDSQGVLLSLTYENYPVGSSLAHVYDDATGYHVVVTDLNEKGDVTPFDINTFSLVPSANASAVPEPSSLVLLGTGALGLGAALRRKLAR